MLQALKDALHEWRAGMSVSAFRRTLLHVLAVQVVTLLLLWLLQTLYHG